jgi:hypothetical protein
MRTGNSSEGNTTNNTHGDGRSITIRVNMEISRRGIRVLGSVVSHYDECLYWSWGGATGQLTYWCIYMVMVTVTGIRGTAGIGGTGIEGGERVKTKVKVKVCVAVGNQGGDETKRRELRCGKDGAVMDRWLDDERTHS